ncbi:major facilitator superfamily domain-containing protein [Aspergillus multicolor]|uniref:major facilitator superfamily domain-containing protein n=1 Tax=Aspergillus multicolor TaxID=41759 RepID=UPI003CCDF4F8
MSDSLGRRPVFLMTFCVYAAASFGLALKKSSYAALAVLRGLQSIGGSAILGLMLASTNLGPCVGPVVGSGAILASGDPLWCFWALLIFGGSSLMLIGWTLPETARTVVGNGAVPAKSAWQAWGDILHARKKHEASNGIDGIDGGTTGKGKWVIPNPLSSVRIIFYRDTFLILWMAASPYTVWYCIQTSIPLTFGKDIYGYNDLIVGLCFLPGGLGVILGGLIVGGLMDWNYKRTAENRISRLYTILSVSVIALIGYGWAVERHTHSSIPLILQAFIGAKCTVVLQMFSALLVDIFPEHPGTAAAANNLTRCALSAAAVAVLQPLSDALGRSWLFTMLGLLDGGLGLLAVWVLRQWGSSWRQKRDA